MSDKPVIHTTEVFKNTVLVYDPPYGVLCYTCSWRKQGKTEAEMKLLGHQHEKDKNEDTFKDAGELHDEAHAFIHEAFFDPDPTELRHHPQEFMINTLASWCENQVFMRKARSWQHALAIFVHEANAGLDFNRPISELTDDPNLLKEWIRGDHL